MWVYSNLDILTCCMRYSAPGPLGFNMCIVGTVYAPGIQTTYSEAITHYIPTDRSKS